MTISLKLPLFVLACALACGACAHVPAYDRGKLANPTMSTSPLDNAGEEHMYVVMEGAAGGGAASGGGCGCN